VRDGVEGHVAGDLVAVDGDGTSANGAAAVAGVRAVFGVGGEVPEEDVFAPVAGGSDEDVGDGWDRGR
jgi:hypothetical protein